MRAATVVLLLLALAACRSASTPPPRPADPKGDPVREAWVRANPDAPEALRAAILRGEVQVGMTPAQAAAAAGMVLKRGQVHPRSMTELVLPGWRVWVWRGKVVRIDPGR